MDWKLAAKLFLASLIILQILMGSVFHFGGDIQRATLHYVIALIGLVGARA